MMEAVTETSAIELTSLYIPPINLTGKWKLVKNENYDEFLQALGVGFIARAAAASQTPTMEIKQDGDGMLVIYTSAIRRVEKRYEVGQEFTEPDQTRPDEEVLYLPTWEGKKLVIKNLSHPTDGIHMQRELVGGMLVQTQQIGHVAAKRIFIKCA